MMVKMLFSHLSKYWACWAYFFIFLNTKYGRWIYLLINNWLWMQLLKLHMDPSLFVFFAWFHIFKNTKFGSKWEYCSAFLYILCKGLAQLQVHLCSVKFACRWRKPQTTSSKGLNNWPWKWNWPLFFTFFFPGGM